MIPAFEDFGEIVLARDAANGYIRVDWFTPDGLPTWGDGRLFVTGTTGSIELRKYVDVAGRPGKDHLFLVDGKGARHIDCSDARLPYYENLRRDIVQRTQTAMPHAHCYKVCELALQAQAAARPALCTRGEYDRRRLSQRRRASCAGTCRSRATPRSVCAAVARVVRDEGIDRVVWTGDVARVGANPRTPRACRRAGNSRPSAGEACVPR